MGEKDVVVLGLKLARARSNLAAVERETIFFFYSNCVEFLLGFKRLFMFAFT